MLQLLKYGISLLILLSVTEGNEVNESKIRNALELARKGIDNARDLLRIYIPSDHTNYSQIEIGLKDLETTLSFIREAELLDPICEKSKLYDKPVDCSEVLANGNTEDGLYSIWPRSRLASGKSLTVYCDMHADGGGWTVIQRRGNFSSQENFYRDWQQYKSGFGNKEKDFWLGNDNIHALTNQAENEIRFDLQDEKGERGFAKYSTFWIDSENSNYTLFISNYTGNVGDCMKHHNTLKFSTKDRGSTQYARFYKGGWWYGDWAHSNLNGRFQPGQASIESNHWWFWRQNKGLASVEIKVRPR